MNMVPIPPALQGRNMGTYPVSIATSRALEGIFGIHEDINYPLNNKYPYKKFAQLAINYRTMIRNIIGSVNSQAADSFTPEILIILIAEEMSLINEIVASASRNNLEVIYYTAGYGPSTLKYLPYANLKSPKTTIQLKERQLENDVLAGLTQLRRLNNPPVILPEGALSNLSGDIPTFSQRLEVSKGVLYLTHLPLDILKTPKGRKALLESHTGKVKGEQDMISKLRGKPKNIPFDIMTIQMFGDTGMTLDSHNSKLRKELSELGEKKGWNATTTESRIKGEIKRNASKELSTLVNQLYSVKVKI